MKFYAKHVFRWPVALLAVLVTQTAVGAPAEERFLQNWPAWRGPLATGVAPQADPPVEFSESKNLKWKVKLPGSGTSTPIVWEQKVFILTAIPTGKKTDSAPDALEIHQFVVLCYDRATGKELWRRVAQERAPYAGHHKDHGYASASPVTDGELLIAHFGSYGTYCYNLDGKLLWEKQLGVMQTRNNFGEGSSPALAGNLVVIVWDHEGDDFIVTLDKRTGKEVWRQKREEPTNWTTPVVVEHGGARQVVVNGTNHVCSYELETGKPLWTSTGQTGNPLPCPVAAKEMVYVVSGFRGSMLQAIKLGRTGDLTGTDAIAWTYKKNTPYVPSPLLYDGLFFCYSGNNAVLTVLDVSSGKPVIDGDRLEGISGVYASPVGATGRVYLAGRDGSLWVIKRSPTLEVLSKNKLDDGFDASPAAVGKELFLRGRKNLYCLTEGK